jgi:hypothetical protein
MHLARQATAEPHRLRRLARDEIVESVLATEREWEDRHETVAGWDGPVGLLPRGRTSSARSSA